MAASTSFVLSILMLVSFRIILSDHPVDSFGCYERKDQINITCNPNTRYAFQDVIYGFPAQTCSESNTNVTCSRNETDCLMHNKFWSFMKNNRTQQCSGSKVCNFQTTWDIHNRNNSTSECQNASEVACFLILKGQCLYEEKKIDFCEQRNISGSKIYIHNPNFPGFDKTGADYECDCAVKSGETLKLDAVLFTLNFKPTNVCSSSLRIYNENYNLTFTCDSQMLQQSINISDSRHINLKLTKSQPWSAYQIWLKIHSVNYEEVTVECKKRKYLGTPPTESTTVTTGPTVQTTTGKSFKEIVSKADEVKLEDFVLGVKIAAGVVGVLIVIILIIITVLTYRRYANIAVNSKNLL